MARAAGPPRQPGARSARGWAALATALAIAVGCSGRESDAPTLVFAVKADVTGFFPNPPITNETFTQAVNWNIVEGLVLFDERLRPQPALAESWDNPDELTYAFTLREGLRFSDGTPVTATDVAASLRAVHERGWVTADTLHAVASAEAEGARRVIVRTRYPYPILLYRLPWGVVLPSHALDRSPVPTIGTGPYRLESWLPGVGFELARNPHYRGPAAAFARVRFEVVPDDDERVARVRTGRAQVADLVPLEQVQALRTVAGLQVAAVPTTRVLFLVFDVTRPPFSDARVREAFDLALDRRELSQRALAGLAEPASQAVAPTVLGYDDELAVTRPDRTRARELLAEAGYGEGLDVRLDGPHHRYANDRGLLAEVARQLAEVGARVSVNALDKTEFFELVARRGSAFHLTGWACQTGEAGSLYEAKLYTRGEGRLGNDNTGGFSDAVLDDLVARQARAPLDERAQLLRQAARRVAELRPLLPLVVQTEAVAVASEVRWDGTLDGLLRLEFLAPSK
jgi:peptide/nickel transport system substrate-binding protein